MAAGPIPERAGRPVRLGVVGAGLIGRVHARLARALDEVELCAVVDPSEHAKNIVQGTNAKWFSSIEEMFSAVPVDGVILATPSALHLSGALICIARRCPVLVEKPLCRSVAEGETLLARARAAGVPVLTGHHRRHGAPLQRARQLIDDGALGRLVAFHGSCWLSKPDDYFDVAWRRGDAGGPLAINLIHDLNAALHLMGDVATVHAFAARAVRAGPCEDTAAVLLRFESGALGTLSVSDTAVSPWNWEMSAGENPDFPHAGGSCYRITGTRGALSLPDLVLWRHERPGRGSDGKQAPGADGTQAAGAAAGQGHWLDPIGAQGLAVAVHDPLRAQMRQFAAVIRGTQAPLVPGEEGLRTLRLLQAARESIETGRSVAPGAL